MASGYTAHAAIRGDRSKTPVKHAFRALTREDVLSPDFGRAQLYYMDDNGFMAQVRRNGAVKTWKRDTSRISIPVKFGLYEAFRVEDPGLLYERIYDNPRSKRPSRSKRQGPHGVMASMTVADRHQTKVARDTLAMPDAMAHVMGGMTKAEARRHLSAMADKYGASVYITPSVWDNPRGVRKGSKERKHMNAWKHSTRVILDKRQRRGTRRGAAKAMKRGHRGRKLQALKGQFDRALAMFRKNPMSRKHYIFMAHYINDAKKMGASDDVLNALYKFAVAVIRNDGNERFDEGRFYDASLGGTRRNPALAIVGAANPPGRYLGHVVEVRYVRRGGKYHGQRFRHTFKSRPRLLAMPDGAIRIA